MLDIATAKVAQIILFAHEPGRGDAELAAFLDGLNEDEQVALVAVMWIGRGSYEPEDLHDALRLARREATTPTADYLTGTPHFADHLEAGMEALGLDILSAEDDLR